MAANDHHYFTKREQHCRDNADRAENLSIRQIYLDFASMYATAAEKARFGQKRSS